MHKVRGVMPQHCLEYSVTDSDTLERVAARFDSTPSTLMKLNRLSSRMVFEGQVLFVPDPANPPPTPVYARQSVSSGEASRPKSLTSEPREHHKTPLIADTKSMKQDHYGSAENQNLAPGKRVEQHIPKSDCDKATNISPAVKKEESTDTSPTVDSELDAECLQRFIKLNVRHFTEAEGVVSGTLLITPNCIMFDPDLNHPLVVENGAEKYGVIVKMEHVMSAGLYTDVSAMTLPNHDSQRRNTFFESSGEHSMKRSSSTTPSTEVADHEKPIIGEAKPSKSNEKATMQDNSANHPSLPTPMDGAISIDGDSDQNAGGLPPDCPSPTLLNGSHCDTATSGHTPDPANPSALSPSFPTTSQSSLPPQQTVPSTLSSAAILLNPATLPGLSVSHSLPIDSTIQTQADPRIVAPESPIAHQPSFSGTPGKSHLTQSHSLPVSNSAGRADPNFVLNIPPSGVVRNDDGTQSNTMTEPDDSNQIEAGEPGSRADISTKQTTSQLSSLITSRMSNIPEVLEPDDVNRLLSAKVNPRRRFVSETDLSPCGTPSRALHQEIKALCNSAESGVGEEIGDGNGATVHQARHHLDVENLLASQTSSCVSCPSSLERALSEQKVKKVGFIEDSSSEISFQLGHSVEDDNAESGPDWDDGDGVEKKDGFIGRRLGNLRSSVKRRKNLEASRLKTMRSSFSRSLSTSASKMTDVIGTGASTVGGALTTGANQVGGALTSGATQMGGALTTGATHVGGAISTGATQVGGVVTAMPKTIAQVPVNIVNMSTGLFSNTDSEDGDTFDSSSSRRGKRFGASASEDGTGRFMEVREAWFGEGLSPQTKDRLSVEIQQRRQRSFAKLEELKQKAAYVRSQAAASQQLVSSSPQSLGGSPRSLADTNTTTVESEGGVDVSPVAYLQKDDAHPAVHLRPHDIKFKCATSQEEGPDLVTPLKDLIPSLDHQPLNTQMPYFFCLKIDKKKRKLESNVHGDAGQLVAVFGYQNRNEYWFTCPREKADSLYMFFIQWSPEKYTNEEDGDAGASESPPVNTRYQGGFVIIDSDEESADLIDKNSPFGPNSLTSHLVPGSLLNREWEIVTVEEVKRRLSLADLIDISKFPLPEGSTDSAILSDEQIRQIVSILPARAEGYPWVPVYSSQEHGFSLRTLFRNMTQWGEDISPTLLVIESVDEGVFGAILSNPLRISEHFYGTGESLLFTFIPEFQEYRWSGDNNFFVKGGLASLAIGAGKGKFGLWLDGDLYHGRTQECETFANPPLTGGSEDFLINRVEAWGFKLMY